jgi:hypothetical protein
MFILLTLYFTIKMSPSKLISFYGKNGLEEKCGWKGGLAD